MATNTPITVPAIPVPTDDPRSLVQSVLAIKDNIERNGPRTTPVTAPTLVNTQLGWAISRVTP
jgi:hypothetical protein